MKKGKIIYKSKSIVKIKSDSNFMYNEIVEFKNGQRGLIIRSNSDEAEIIIFEDINDEQSINIGDEVILTDKEACIKTSSGLLGAIVSGEGKIIERFDNAKKSEKKQDDSKIRNIFEESRTVYSRDFVNRYLETGTTIIDWAIPIGKGQRELVIGDRKTGKTSIAFNILLAQKNNDTKCVYVSIGQKRDELVEIVNRIKENKMQNKVSIVYAAPNEIATMRYMVPYVGMTIAEHFQKEYGDDVLIIFDDLSKHAIAYREISLLLDNPPTRDAYPGDIFYIHSSLLERSGAFRKEYGGGSITAIPIIQTENSDISSFIPTNVISITDGQIFTSKEMFNSYQRPAINVPYSVSRIGSSAQGSIMKKYASRIKYIMSRYTESIKMKDNYGFVSKTNDEIIKQGDILFKIINQSEKDISEYDINTILIILFKKNYLSFIKNKNVIYKIKSAIKDYLSNTKTGNKLSNVLKSIDKDVDKKLLSMFLELEILPIVKFYLLINDFELEKDKKFIELFGEIRNNTSLFVKHKEEEKIKNKLANSKSNPLLKK